MQFSLFRKRDATLLLLFFLCVSIVIFLVTNPILPVERETVNFDGASSNTLREHVTFLSTLEPTRNYRNLDSLNQSAKFIADEFDRYCDVVEQQIFKVDNVEYKNIICSFNVEGAKNIIVGAHYDTFSSTPGADDNASGIAGILELSRLLAENDTDGNRIDLIAYTLEEPPHFRSNDMGSYRHAELLTQTATNVELVMILEMIGFFTEEENSQTFPTVLLKPFYPSEGNFIAIVSKFGLGSEVKKAKKLLRASMDMDVYSINAPAFIPGIDFSDHLSYWKKDFPALMITDTSFYRNQNYHTNDDTPDTLNYEKMADVVNGAYWTILNY